VTERTERSEGHEGTAKDSPAVTERTERSEGHEGTAKDSPAVTERTEPEPPQRVREAIRSATPPRCVYVYDTQTLRERAAAVRAALPGNARLLYAVKANGHPAVLAALAGVVDGFEVASAGELALARAAAEPAAGPGLIAFSGPGKTDAELAAALAASAIVHVESLLELRRLAHLAAGTARTARIALRVNRRHAAVPGTHAMTGVATPFGIDEESLPAAVELAAHPGTGLRLIGFHLHAVSNNLDAAAHGRFVADCLHWALAASARYRVPLRYLNLGGGFGIDYSGAAQFSLPVLAKSLAGSVADAADRLPDGAILVVEPGRYLAAPAGWYAAEVLDLKRTHGRWFAVLRGGTHHFRLPAAWGYSHPCQVLAQPEWPYPFARPEMRDGTVDVVGELCTPRDVLARDLPVSRLRAGDVLVMPLAGGYGWDISHHDFLRHSTPEFRIV
jgi:2-[(L-alanin-3-ylcarbamoyl)methyl]-2-hydroxybutanedioate decarboxylase